eukprot:scaffold49711_cov19-Tisochrysis_lutea.AAC.3
MPRTAVPFFLCLTCAPYTKRYNTAGKDSEWHTHCVIGCLKGKGGNTVKKGNFPTNPILSPVMLFNRVCIAHLTQLPQARRLLPHLVVPVTAVYAALRLRPVRRQAGTRCRHAASLGIQVSIAFPCLITRQPQARPVPRPAYTYVSATSPIFKFLVSNPNIYCTRKEKKKYLRKSGPAGTLHKNPVPRPAYLSICVFIYYWGALFCPIIQL